MQNQTKEAEVRNNQNHVEKSVVEVMENDAVGTIGNAPAMEVGPLVERRKELLSELNGMKADLEALTARREQTQEQVHRTTGALMMLNGLIYEIDPQAARQLGIGGGG
jgi:FtsZ-binding cell division protein ZapB